MAAITLYELVKEVPPMLQSIAGGHGGGGGAGMIGGIIGGAQRGASHAEGAYNSTQPLGESGSRKITQAFWSAVGAMRGRVSDVGNVAFGGAAGARLMAKAAESNAKKEEVGGTASSGTSTTGNASVNPSEARAAQEILTPKN